MAAANSSEVLETAPGGLPLVQFQGLNTNKAVNFSNFQVDTSGNVSAPGTMTVSGAATITGGLTQTGALTPTGGVAAAGGFSVPTVYHSGQVQEFGALTTNYTHTQIVTTDTYYCEVFVPANCVLTGISLLNGGTTNASVNLSVGLANSSGVIVAKSATTVAQAAANAYQQIPFTSTYSAVGPAKYYIAVQGSTTTGYIATHTKGNFGANLLTSETFGTFLTTASYATTTFTTNTGPIADTY